MNLKVAFVLVLLLFASTFASTVATAVMAPGVSTPSALGTSKDVIYNIGSDVQRMGDPVGGGGFPH